LENSRNRGKQLKPQKKGVESVKIVSITVSMDQKKNQQEKKIRNKNKPWGGKKRARGKIKPR
jgi:hypothetical protein